MHLRSGIALFNAGKTHRAFRQPSGFRRRSLQDPAEMAKGLRGLSDNGNRPANPFQRLGIACSLRELEGGGTGPRRGQDRGSSQYRAFSPKARSGNRLEQTADFASTPGRGRSQTEGASRGSRRTQETRLKNSAATPFASIAEANRQRRRGPFSRCRGRPRSQLAPRCASASGAPRPASAFLRRSIREECGGMERPASEGRPYR